MWLARQGLGLRVKVYGVGEPNHEWSTWNHLVFTNTYKLTCGLATSILLSIVLLFISKLDRFIPICHELAFLLQLHICVILWNYTVQKLKKHVSAAVSLNCWFSWVWLLTLITCPHNLICHSIMGLQCVRGHSGFTYSQWAIIIDPTPGDQCMGQAQPWSDPITSPLSLLMSKVLVLWY